MTSLCSLYSWIIRFFQKGEGTFSEEWWIYIYQFTSKLKYWPTPISDKRIPGHWRHHAGEGIVCPICPSFHHLESICPNLSTWTLGVERSDQVLVSVCREEKIHRDIGCRFLLTQTALWDLSWTSTNERFV